MAGEGGREQGAGFPLGSRERRKEGGKLAGLGVFLRRQEESLGNPVFEGNGDRVSAEGTREFPACRFPSEGHSNSPGIPRPPPPRNFTTPRPQAAGVKQAWPRGHVLTRRGPQAPGKRARPAGARGWSSLAPRGPAAFRRARAHRPTEETLPVTVRPDRHSPPTRPLSLSLGQIANGDLG